MWGWACGPGGLGGRAGGRLSRQGSTLLRPRRMGLIDPGPHAELDTGDRPAAAFCAQGAAASEAEAGGGPRGGPRGGGVAFHTGVAGGQTSSEALPGQPRHGALGNTARATRADGGPAAAAAPGPRQLRLVADAAGEAEALPGVLPGGPVPPPGRSLPGGAPPGSLAEGGSSLSLRHNLGPSKRLRDLTDGTLQGPTGQAFAFRPLLPAGRLGGPRAAPWLRGTGRRPKRGAVSRGAGGVRGGVGGTRGAGGPPRAGRARAAAAQDRLAAGAVASS